MKLKISILAVLVVLCASVLSACEPLILLTVENNTSTDLVIVKEAMDQDGVIFSRVEMGRIPANQTARTEYAFFPDPKVIGWTMTLKAQDDSGNIVWEKSYTFDEFRALDWATWKIVIPEQK